MVRLVFNIVILLGGLVFDVIKMIGVGEYQSWTPLELWSFFIVNIFLIMCGIAKSKEYEKQELNEGMNKLVNAIARLNMNPIEDNMLIFMASAGMIMASADGKVTEKEYEQILNNMSCYYMFALDILKKVTPENCTDLLNQSIANILKEKPDLAPELFGYLVNILVSDQQFDKKEIELLFNIGQSAMGLDQETMLKCLAGGIQRFFIPNIGSIS